MTPPILRVKKGAVIYDDTEARRAAEERPWRALPGGPGRPDPHEKGRRIRLTYLPLLILAVGLFATFYLAQHRPANRAVMEGWQVILRATPYQDRLIVGLTFIAGSSIPESPAGPPRARALVVLEGTGTRITLEGTLEKSPMTLRGEMPYSPGGRRVRAEISVDGARRALWVPVPEGKSQNGSD